MFEALRSQIAADAFIFFPAKLHGANGGKVQRICRRLDVIFRAGSFGKLDSAFLPDLRDVVLPGLAHATNKTFRSTQQQNVRPQRVSPGQDGQIL